MYSGSARLVSFEIKLISKEATRAEPEYMNIHPPPPVSVLATALLKSNCKLVDQKCVKCFIALQIFKKIG